MARFHYKASDLEGKISNGEIEAINGQEATKSLAQRQLFVVEIEKLSDSSGIASKTETSVLSSRAKPNQIQDSPAPPPPRSTPKRRFTQKFTLMERTLYLRQTAVMFTAGIPLHRCTSVLCASYPTKLQEQLKSIPKDLEKGRPLSRAFERSSLFNHLVVSAIKVGEESGNLDSILCTLADGEERRLKIGRSIVSRLTYPLTVLVILVLGVVVLAHFMADVMQSMVDQDTAAMSVLNLLVSPYFLPGCLLLGLLIWRASILYIRQPRRRKKLERILLALPKVGRFIVCHETQILTGNLALLLKAGLPLNRCLGLCSDLVRTEHFKELLTDARLAITEGTTLSEALAQKGWLHQDVLSLIHCGEQSGKTELALEKVSEYSSETLERSLEALMSMLEPVMIAGLGLTLGLLLLFTFSPIIGAIGDL